MAAVAAAAQVAHSPTSVPIWPRSRHLADLPVRPRCSGRITRNPEVILPSFSGCAGLGVQNSRNGLPLTEVCAMEQLVWRTLAARRLTTLLLSVFAGSA